MVELDPCRPLRPRRRTGARTPARRARRRTSRDAAVARRSRPRPPGARSAYSRIVSSIRKRSSPIGFRRLESTSAARPSRSASHTSSAASSGKLPAKTASRAKRSFARRVEEVVAPLDRRAQRALTLGRVTRAAREERESRVEALEEPFWTEKLRASRCELDRERQPVESAADRVDRGIAHDLPPDCARALDEEALPRRRQRAGRAGTRAPRLHAEASGS